jgi:hypothetical protein
MMRGGRFLFLLAAACAWSGPAPLSAQEFSAQGGLLGTGTSAAGTYAWEVQYLQHFGRHFAWSGAWINEGHTSSHHRDGLAAELWAEVPAELGDLSLALGAGAYSFSDTHLLHGDGFQNVHGWTPIFSLALTYYTHSPWFLRMTGNHISRAASLQTNALLIGGGYQLGWKRTHPSEPAVRRLRSGGELTAFAGRSIVNSRSSEEAGAVAVEYRKNIGRYSDWTAAFIDEGDPKIIRRLGIATQVWLVDNYRGRRLSLGIGAGPYLIFQRRGPPETDVDYDTSVAALVSPTVSYHFSNHWLTRLTWNRVISRDDRDADVILLGLGYRWGRD